MEEDLYIQNLEEYVNDESKLVTYKWFSRQLNIHVNLAKQLMYSFVQQQQGNGIRATYNVVGISAKGAVKSFLVSEKEVDTIKQSLASVNSALFHISASEGSKYADKLKGAIDCVAATVTNAPSTLRSQKEVDVTETKTEVGSGSGGDIKARTVPKTSKPKASVSSFFGQKTAKTEKKAVKKEAPQSDTKEETAAEEGKENRDIAASDKSDDVTVESNGDSRDTQGTKELGERRSENNESDKSKKKKESTRGRKQKAASDTSQEKQPKRRRIKVLQSDSDSEPETRLDPSPERQVLAKDSESEDETVTRENDEDAMDVDSPKEKKKRSKKKASDRPGKVNVGDKVKKRKLVTRNYVDDDGFMVSEKVYEECTDDEEDEVEQKSAPVVPDVTEKKSPKNPSPQKQKKNTASKAAATGNKQSTLMSFFKKK